MRIRHAQAIDGGGIADVFLAASVEMAYLRQGPDEESERRWIEDLVHREEFWVAEEGGEILGFAGVSEGQLHFLYAHPRAQRKGVGSALLAFAKERCSDGLELWVFQKNVGARRFYERHGFALVRETDGLDNRYLEADALYEWRPSAKPSEH